MKNLRNIRNLFAVAAVTGILLSACDQNRKKVNIQNSTDTNNVTKAGGPPIRDTATITKDRKDSAKAGNNTAKGNVDPTGHANK